MSKNYNTEMIKLIILESPYAATKDRTIHDNEIYARACLRDSLLRGESPIASHLLYTQDGVLNDLNPIERKIGINAGLAWKRVAKCHVFYIDYGISKGMRYALSESHKNKYKIEFRKILN